MVAGDDGTNDSAENQPVGIPQQGEENILDVDFLRFLLVEERSVVFCVCHYCGY